MPKTSAKRTPKYVEILVKVPVTMIGNVADAAGLMVSKADVYAVMVKNKKAIASDMVDMWSLANEYTVADDIIMGLFGDKWFEKHGGQ